MAVRITGQLLRETEKAFLIATQGQVQGVWLPKSHVSVEAPEVFFISEWIAQQKGLWNETEKADPEPEPVAEPVFTWGEAFTLAEAEAEVERFLVFCPEVAEAMQGKPDLSVAKWAQGYLEQQEKDRATKAAAEAAKQAKAVEAQEAARVQAEAEARHVARLEAQGKEVCPKCGGQGGWRGWPGFTCFKCGGEGSVPMSKAEIKRRAKAAKQAAAA